MLSDVGCLLPNIVTLSASRHRLSYLELYIELRYLLFNFEKSEGSWSDLIYLFVSPIVTV